MTNRAKSKVQLPPANATRRTTLTLPAECLDQAARIASERHVNLSVVMSEALTEGLQTQLRARRADEILEAYKNAFAGFSDEDLLVLDGIVLQPLSESAAAGKRR